MGILAAVMAMVREQDAFFVVAPALDLIVFALRTNDRREWFRLLRGTLAGTAAAVVAYLPQALAYLALNGHLGPSHLVARKMTWTAPHAMDVLASPSHGFLTWTPLALLALAGLAWLPRTAARTRAIGVVTMSLALAVACQIYVGGSVESWTVAGAFGQRRFVALTPILVIGLAACLAGVRLQARRVMAVATAVLVWWNLGLVVQFGAGLMNRQRLEPTRVAYTSFVVLPARLPELAWRYVFDRTASTIAANRTTAARGADAAVRILYLADIRFPLERANGIQTFETCFALAERGHEITLAVRPDTHRPARDPFAFYGRDRESRLHVEARAALPGPLKRASYVARTVGLAASRRFDAVITRDLGIAAMLLRLPRGLRPPLVYQSHGYTPAVSGALPQLLGNAQSPSRSKLARLAARESRVWHGAEGYITITRALAAE